MRSRIAVFEGYAAPSMSRYGAPIFQNPRQGVKRMSRYGAPLFQNPRVAGYGAPLFQNPRSPSLGRRAYYVAERAPSEGVPHRKGYKVKRKANTPAMKRAMGRFAKAAKKCSRTARKNGFQACMKRELKKKSKR